MSVADYNTAPDQNTSISGINVAEGCLPSNVNNAIRQLMADIAQEHTDVAAKIESALKQISDVSGDLDKHKVPKGTIALWSGTTADIPTGWALCNGQAGTKDLRNRFVLVQEANINSMFKIIKGICKPSVDLLQVRIVHRKLKLL